MAERSRAAQRVWARRPIAERLRVVRRFRGLLARRGDDLARATAGARGRDLGEVLTAEVLPLAEACRFLEREAAAILRTRKPATPRPALWLGDTRVEIAREPLGLVLVIGPSNYPLFLPAAQALQALVAGNAVWIKPGEGGAGAALMVVDLLRRAGLPRDLCRVLPEDRGSAESAIDFGVDKILLTGSSQTGRSVLARAAQRLTPATVELAGCDPVFVLPGADIDLVARALCFGLRLNDGATCIAPRRVFAGESVAARLAEALTRLLEDAPAAELPPIVAERAAKAIEEATTWGARLVSGGPPRGTEMRPTVLRELKPGLAILESDLFAPVLSILEVDDIERAPDLAAECPYALGATIFGPEAAARRLASRIRAGVVSINDLIVPTADPRVPFGGSGESGFGVTRGAEGLLELTRPKTLTSRRGKRRPHLEPLPADATRLFLAYLRFAHAGSWRERLSGLAEVARAGRRSIASRRRTSS